MKKLFKIALSITAATALLTSCRASKQAGVTDDYASSSLDSRIEQLAARDTEWAELNVPVKIEMREPISLSASGRAYMRRDEDIYISLRMLGFEVATLYVTADSIYAADKWNRRYIAEPIGALLAGADITVADIQDILTGRVFINGEGALTPADASKVKLAETADTWSVTPAKTAAGAEYTFTLDKADNTLRSLAVTVGNREVTCYYADPVMTDKGAFMSQAMINAVTPSRKIEVTFKPSFSSAKWSIDNSARWREPSGYTRVDGATLLKALTNM